MPREHPVRMDGALHPCRGSTPFVWMELSIHAEGAPPSYGWSSPSIRREHPVHMDGALHPYEGSTHSAPEQCSDRLTDALAPCRMRRQIDHEARSYRSPCGRHAPRGSALTNFSPRFAKPPRL